MNVNEKPEINFPKRKAKEFTGPKCPDKVYTNYNSLSSI